METITDQSPSGFLLINKPAGITSFRCLGIIKRLLADKTIKVGHAGTLDSFATGLLIVAVSRLATRHIDAFAPLAKTYHAVGKLGELTDTQDRTGEVVQTCVFKEVTRDALQNAITALGSSYTQVPPLYSARKFQGYRLYKLARSGEVAPDELTRIAQIKKKTIRLYNVELQDFTSPLFTLVATVSHGTYIRSLINDIATGAGSCATTMQLERAAIGSFNVADAVDPDTLRSKEDLCSRLIPVEQMLEAVEQEKKAL